MKRQKLIVLQNLFDLLSEELVFAILDRLGADPFDKKTFSKVCKSLYAMEANHRRTFKPLRSEHLPGVLARYRHVTHLDLSLCPRVTDKLLDSVSTACGSSLRSVDLSRSGLFSGNGLLGLALNCRNLTEMDLSNATELRDCGAAAVAEAGNLEKLWLGRCRMVTDLGIGRVAVGCTKLRLLSLKWRVAVGCTKLRLLSLKWCVGVGDLGVAYIALKCTQIRSFDLSYLPITSQCLPLIFKLEYLEDLVLEGCFGIEDEDLADFKHECNSLKTFDLSSCQNISHVGLSSLTSGTRNLRQLILANASPVTIAVANSFQNLSTLQSLKLDGCHVTCSGLKAIGDGCSSLQELSLSKCSGVTDDGLSSLVTKQRELRKLDVTCCRKITYVSILHITNSCTALASLRMESCALVPAQAFVLIGAQCHFLEELDLTDNEIDDEGLRSISRCSKLSILKLGICLNISDGGLSHIGTFCSKLTELDLYRSAGITDSGISAIARGCPALETINIAYCKDITDGSLFSLSKCSRLTTLESRGCPMITSLGLAAIAVGCKLLTKLDIKKCYNVDDAGIIRLARFSHNLTQINLSYSCVTDVGLLSLANISCLQNITILQLKGLSPHGLAAVLLACGGLTKVKLQASFKSLLPSILFEHLEARGCVFQWSDRVVEAELEPRCWKLLL